MDSAVVIGVGPIEGLGAQLAIRFASHGLHTYVAGRTQSKIDAVVEEISNNGHSATAVLTNATDEAQVDSLFSKVEEDGNRIVVGIYNTGNNTPGRIVDMEPGYFEHSWRVCCYGGFLFAQRAIRRMLEHGGTLLFTGASASLRGRSGFGAFNSSKAALRTLAQALAKEYGPDGIHVGHVVIDGPIGGEKIKKGLPEYAERLGTEGMIDLQGIVDAYEYLYKQPRNAWSFEVDVRTSIETW